MSSGSLIVRGPKNAMATAGQQRFVNLSANDRTFFAPARLRHEFGLDRPYQQHGWTYAIVRAFARNLAKLPLVVKTGTRANSTTVLPGMLGYEWQELFDRPNPMTTDVELKEALAIHLKLHGECIVVKVPLDDNRRINEYERPFELYPFNGREFVHVMDKRRQRIIGWMHMIPGVRDAEAYLSHEVIQAKQYNPYYPARGLADHEAARTTTQTDWKTSQYQEAFFDNDATPGVVLMSEFELSGPQRQELREAWEERHRGYRRRSRVAVLESGMKMQAMGESHKDMEYETGRRFSIEELCAIYGVPDSELSNYKNLNFATASTVKVEFFTNSIFPVCEIIEKAFYLHMMLDAGRGRYWLEFDKSAVEALVETELTKLQAAKAAQDIGTPYNEVIEKFQLGLKRQPGWGDAPLLPTQRFDARNYSLGIVKPPATPPHPGFPPHPGSNPANHGEDEPKPKDGEQPDDGGKSPGSDGEPFQPASEGPTVISAPTELDVPLPDNENVWQENDEREVRIRIWNETRAQIKTQLWEQILKKTMAPNEIKFGRRYRSYLYKLRKEQLKRLEKSDLGKKAFFYSDGIRAGNLDALLELRADLDKVLFDKEVWDSKLKEMHRPLYGSIATDAAGQAIEELGGNFGFDLGGQGMLDALHRREEILASTNTTLRSATFRQLELGLKAGESPQQLAERVKTVFNLTGGKAMTIARTETAGMVNTTRHEVHKQEDLEQNEWLTARDEDVRDSHAEQDGVVVAVGEAFPNGLIYPCQLDGPPDEVINCRCVAIPAEE